MTETKNIYKLLEPYKYISFDIFDTLILRTVSHFELIHQMVQHLYYEYYGEFLENYPKIRMKAEILARSLPGISEVTMDMIYYELTQYDDKVKNRLKELEEKCEVENCVPNPPMIEVLHWCKMHRKKIVIITDMYLSRDILNRILTKIGVTYDYLFISGEEGCTKRTGNLFKIALKKIAISPSEIIHIGDDINNDINMPKTKGISSILRLINSTIDPPYMKFQKKLSIEADHLYSLLRLNNSINPQINPEYRIGYHVLGPLIVNFCQWLHQIKKEQKLDKLLFVAREGYYILKVYKEMYPNECSDINYIRLNKNMLRLPLLSLDNPCKYFMQAKLGRPEYEWNLIFDLLYISDIQNAQKHVTLQTGFSDFTTKISLKDLERGKYNQVLLSLFNYQKEMILNQANMLHEYINDLGIYNNKVGLVNNSMNGSGQSMLQDFIKASGKQCDIVGLQFIKTEKCNALLGSKCRAWLTENKSISEFQKSHFHYNCLLLEHLMFEPQGTSLFLETQNGKVDVYCEPPRTEQKDFEKIASIQKSGLQFTKDYITHINLHLNTEGFYNYYHMLCHPYYDDAHILCHLNDDDSDGDKEISNLEIPFKWKYLLSKDIPFDITWREGYFKLKRIPEWGINVYHIYAKYKFARSYIKRQIKKTLSLP